jgi:hypothetical protein
MKCECCEREPATTATAQGTRLCATCAANLEPTANNPIMDFARELREAPPVAEAPFALTPTTGKTRRTTQTDLFGDAQKDQRR